MFFNSECRKKWISLTAAVVAAFLIPVSAYAASNETGVVNYSHLNVRSGPGVRYSITYGLSRGDSVTILEEENGWYKVKLSNSKTGWVAGNYIKKNAVTSNKTEKKTDKTSDSTKKSDTVKDQGMGTCKVSGEYTNLRKGAGTSYEIITRLYKDTCGAITDYQGAWLKIKLADGTAGWVSNKYVKTTGFTKEAVSKAQQQADSGKIIVTGYQINVRDGASSSAAKVGTVRHNEVYTYTSLQKGWYCIRYSNGKKVYLSADYAKPFTKYAVDGGGSYVWPTPSATRISSPFGVAEDVRNGRKHNGLDIAAPGGSQILAVAAGKVIKKGYEPDAFGYYVAIEQYDGIRTYYAHMREASFLSVGTKVKAGDVIGIVGTTGHSTGNHLHLEMRKGSKRLDPLTYYPNMQ